MSGTWYPRCIAGAPDVPDAVREVSTPPETELIHVDLGIFKSYDRIRPLSRLQSERPDDKLKAVGHLSIQY